MNLVLADDNHDDYDDIAALVKRAMEGDEQAFEKLFWLFSDRIYRYLRPKIRNSEEASDIVQDTFLAAWKNIQDLHDPASFRSWLYRIARNKALNHIRHENIVRRLLWRWKDPDTPIVIYEQLPRESVLLKLALELVNPTWRECLILQVIHGLSTKEIAKIIGKSDGTVRRHIKDVMEQLAEIYQYLDIFFRSKEL